MRRLPISSSRITIRSDTLMYRLYTAIKSKVDIETARLASLEVTLYTGPGKDKAEKINKALDDLKCAIYIKENISEFSVDDKNFAAGDMNLKEISEASFSTIDSMLDFRISSWRNAEPDFDAHGMEFKGHDAGFEHRISLRRALNISRNNFFSNSTNSLGPLWGKSETLINVEEDLSQTRTLEFK